MLKKFCTVAIVSLIAIFSFAQTDLMTKAISRFTEFAKTQEITVSKANDAKDLEKMLEDETLVASKEDVSLLKAYKAKKAAELSLNWFGGKDLNVSVARPVDFGASAKTATSDVDTHGIITSPEEGEHKYYNRAGTAYYPNNNQLAMGTQSGVIEIVECTNGDVYLKNIISKNSANTWVKGVKSNNTITVATGQPVSYSSNYGATLSVRFGVIATTGNISLLSNAPDSITFTIDGNTISLQGTVGYTDGTVDAPFIGIFWDDDDAFSGYGDAESVYTLNEGYQPASTELVVLPEGAQTAEWYYQLKQVSSSSSVKKNGKLNVAFVGDDVYVQGLTLDFPSSWIKGTKDAQGVVTFSGLQFVGTYGTYNIWATGVDPEEGALEDFKMQFTAEPASLVSVNDLLENAKEDAVYYLGWFTEIKLTADEPVVEEPTAVTGDPVVAPYVNELNSQDEFNQFGVLDINEDGSTWSFATSMAKYAYNGTNDGDDWLISPAIKLEAGKPYLFSIDAKSSLSSYPEKFEVKMGTAAKPSKLSTVVIEPTTVAVSSLTNYAAPVTVAETGYYHIGVHAISDADQFYLYVDNFKVVAGGSPAAVSNLKLEADGNNGTLSFVMPTKNAGGQDLTGALSYTYVLNEGEVVEEAASAIGAEVSIPVTLKNGQNKIKVYAVNDEGTSDAAEVSHYVAAVSNVPVTFSFATADDFAPMTVIDANDDAKTWIHNATASRPTARYKYHSSNVADDWMITPAIKLTAGRVYVLKYIATSYSASYPETLEIKVGKGTTVADMTQTVQEAYNPSNDKTAVTEVEFSVAADGNYNIGFHALSQPDMFYLDVDYITVEAGPLPEAPAAVSALTAEAGAQGALEATIKFKAPTKNIAGNDVAALTAIAIVDEVGAVYEVEPAVAGQEYSIKLDSLTNGTHTWTVTAYNEFGNGQKASVSAFVGQDVPEAPEASLTDQKTSIKVEWEAVTEGANGGYINPEGLTYELYALEESMWGTTVGDKIGETQGTSLLVEYNTDEGEMDLLQFAMRTVGAGGNSSYAGTSGLVVGAPEGVPYVESFANGSINHFLWLETANGEGSWGLSKTVSADGDGGCAGFAADAADDECSLITGKITLAGVANPQLLFQSKFAGATLKIQAQKRNGTVVDLATIAASADWTAQQVDLNSLKNEDYIMIRFTAIASAADDVVYVDAVQIRDVLDHNLEMSLSAPAKVNKGEKFVATVNVINQGSNAATGYKVKVNDKEVVESETLASYASKNYTFEFQTSIFDEAESLVLSAEVIYDKELKPEDNSDEAEVVLVASTAAKVSELKGEDTENGVVLTWTAPTASSETVTEGFEGFENNQAAPYTANPDGQTISFLTNWNKEASLGDWTCYDMDGGCVYGWNSGSNFPYMGDAMGWVVIDVEEDFTTAQTAYAHEGTKALFCMNIAPATGGPAHNDDWLISPELSGDAQTISFYANEITNQYGSEEFEILYSTTDKAVESFTKIGATHQLLTEEFVEVSAELPAGAKYFAIRCISTDIFGLIIDDITYAKGASAPESFNVYRDQAKVANVTETTYTDVAEAGTHSYAVTAVYANGVESAPVSVSVATGITTISSEKAFNVYSVDGKLVRKEVKMVNDLEPGVYVINNQKVTVK